MNLLRPLAAIGLLCAASVSVPGSANAESFHTCTGFIDTLPATISTQGVWCLRRDVATAIAGGTAITVNAHNVTINCNGFKIGGQSAGSGTQSNGITSHNRLNTTVRNCNVRGFMYGVLLVGGGGHQVEDNRADGNTYTGLFVTGDGSVVRRNHVLDTGESTLGLDRGVGIYTYGAVDLVDNTVENVYPTGNGTSGTAYGLLVESNAGGTIVGNRVRGLVPAGTGQAVAIGTNMAMNVAISGNFLAGPGTYGINCAGTMNSLAKDNFIIGFSAPVTGCADLGNSP